MRTGRPPRPVAERFAKYVHKTCSCHLWTASTYGDHGYGRFTHKGKAYGAHRVSYVLKHKVKLSEDDRVLHSCDNPICVNPDHLFIGTQQDNMQDMCLKGRHWQQQRTKRNEGGRFSEISSTGSFATAAS